MLNTVNIIFPVALLNCPDIVRLSGALPISDLHRVQVVPQPFDPASIYEASKLFLGTWNFRTFSKISKNQRPAAEEDYFKTVRRISLTRSSPFIPLSYFLDPSTPNLDFYDFHVEGSGFLRRQVHTFLSILTKGCLKFGFLVPGLNLEALILLICCVNQNAIFKTKYFSLT
jgi:hypothetical protein